MINHISIGVRDMPAAGRFYHAALKPIGYKRLYDSAEALGYGAQNPGFWVMQGEQPSKRQRNVGVTFLFGRGEPKCGGHLSRRRDQSWWS